MLIRRQLENGNYLPYITKDGVSVAQFVKFKDQEKELGARIVAQSAASTVSNAGDGTTTSIVLANALVQGGASASANMVDVVKGMEAAEKDIMDYLENNRKDMTSDKIKQISYISTNNDDDLSNIVTAAFDAAGDDGIVDVKLDPMSSEVTLDVKKGTRLQSGITHRQMITDVNHNVASFPDGAFILVTDASFMEIGQIECIFQHVIALNKPIIIIGEFEQRFSDAFVQNLAKGNVQGALINPGAFVDSNMLKDLATLTGATYFDNAAGNNMSFVNEDMLGWVDNATVGFGFSLFAMDNPGDTSKTLDELKSLIDKGGEDWEVKAWKERVQMLSGVFTTINVGAPTKGKADEVKDRLDDAVSAVGAARKYGYLPGGGVALKDASKSLTKKDDDSGYSEGYNLFIEAVKAPMNKILDNAGIEYTDLPCCEGIDASNGESVNMIDEGIIDPAFVTMQAVLNATAASTVLLSTKATIIEDLD